LWGDIFMVTKFLWKLQLPVSTFVMIPLLRIITRHERLASHLTLLTRSRVNNRYYLFLTKCIVAAHMSIIHTIPGIIGGKHKAVVMSRMTTNDLLTTVAIFLIT